MDWRKSSYSGSNGGDCVEVGWRKASYSNSNGGSCVETASDGGAILVRDTTDRDGGTLAFSPDAWQTFTANLK